MNSPQGLVSYIQYLSFRTAKQKCQINYTWPLPWLQHLDKFHVYRKKIKELAQTGKIHCSIHDNGVSGCQVTKDDWQLHDGWAGLGLPCMLSGVCRCAVRETKSLLYRTNSVQLVRDNCLSSSTSSDQHLLYIYLMCCVLSHACFI